MALEAVANVENNPGAADLWHAVGQTPLVALRHLDLPPGVRLLAKLEGCNPGGSVKDRPALAMLRQAKGPGGVGCRQNHFRAYIWQYRYRFSHAGSGPYKVELVMPPCVSRERQRVLEALGARVVLSAEGESTDGAIRLAHERLHAAPEHYYMPNQYANPANPQAHYDTTGPEIWRQTGGDIKLLWLDWEPVVHLWGWAVICSSKVQLRR